MIKKAMRWKDVGGNMMKWYKCMKFGYNGLYYLKYVELRKSLVLFKPIKSMKIDTIKESQNLEIDILKKN